MPLSAGTRLGVYEIIGPLGAGGMGEVYRARDARLGRDVAVKVLPAAFAADADRLRRFEQEARAAGLLNHPNILVVHDTGFAAGSPYLVSELLDGETLRARLSHGRLSTTSALEIAGQIVRGLYAAHAKGIVHRDLKPDNVFVTTDGRVKILDFGLAKLANAGSADAADQTATAYRTEAGVVMGTAGYMAPEQVRGDAVDSRADLFAFGAILYEMLCGARAFSGDSVVETMHAVLRVEPPEATSVNPALAPALGRIVRRCLEKQPASRFQSAADLGFAIETATQSTPSGPAAAAHTTADWAGVTRAGARAGWVAAGLLGIAFVSLAIAYYRLPPADARVFTASVLSGEGAVFGSLVLSPDGRWLAYTDTSGSGKSQLWIRSLDQAVVKTEALPGTEGASNPFWSPDSRSLGFFANNQLRAIDIAGGSPRTIAKVSDNRGGTWNRDGVIVFSPDLAGPLYRTPAVGGGSASPVTTVDRARQEGTHRWPSFLPDGVHFLYFVRSLDPDHVGVYLGSLDGGPAVRLEATSTNAIYAPPGFLIFVRDGALVARPFDLRSLQLTGEPRTLIPKAGFRLTLNQGLFSASDNGVLVYAASQAQQPVWFDRNGQAQQAISTPEEVAHLWLSPDDKRVAVERPDPRTGANDVGIIDLDRGGILTRFTTHPASDIRALWLSARRSIVWASARTGPYDLYEKPEPGAGEETLLYKSAESKVPTGGSPDGKFLLFESADRNAKSSLWALPLTGEPVPFRLLDSGFNEGQARFSADGRWIAYTTDTDGTFEIYVVDADAVLPTANQAAATRPRPARGVRISTGGGTQPLWRLDGKKTELFYLAPDRRLMVVTFDDRGPHYASAPQALFGTRIFDVGRTFQHFAVSADGQRFLVLSRVAETREATVVLNWAAALTGGAK